MRGRENSERRLEAVDGLPPIGEDQAGVVDEHVESVVAGEEVVGEPPDRAEVGKIELHHLHGVAL